MYHYTIGIVLGSLVLSLKLLENRNRDTQILNTNTGNIELRKQLPISEERSIIGQILHSANQFMLDHVGSGMLN